jgi:hypothetical protein
MRRAAFAIAVFASSLLAPWPLTLALAAIGAAIWPAYVEGAAAFALVEGAALADRDGVAWLPLTAAALALAGVAEIARPLLSRGDRSTV